MLIDFKAVITELDGTPMMEQRKDNKLAEVTLGAVCANALLATYQDEQNLPGLDKVNRFRLAEKVSKSLPVDLSVEDVALIKSLVARGFGPLIVGRTYDLIEPPVVKAEEA